MSDGTLTFWDIYLFGPYPICGTVVVVIAIAIFIAGVRDHPERKLLWVGTIACVLLFGFFLGEASNDLFWSDYIESDVEYENDSLMIRFYGGRMMFMAQGGLAVTVALALLWWPIRPKEES